jgi:hypothetical protein
LTNKLQNNQICAGNKKIEIKPIEHKQINTRKEPSLEKLKNLTSIQRRIKSVKHYEMFRLRGRASDIDVENEDNIEEIIEIVPSGQDNATVRPHSCSKIYPEEWKTNETKFCCEDTATFGLNEYQRQHKCPLALERTGGRPDLQKKKKGKLHYSCPHGLTTQNRKRTKFIDERKQKKQHLNNVGCLMKIHINQQMTGNWILRLFNDEHINKDRQSAHMTGDEMYKLSIQKKKLVENEALEKIRDYTKLNAPTATIAKKLSEDLDVNYDVRDIINRKEKVALLMAESDQENIAIYLQSIINDGGKAVPIYYKDTKNCCVLVICTKYMLTDLKMTQPKVFICDTTFNTNDEGLKLHLLNYKSCITGKTEIAAYVFLEAETEVNVQEGFKLFRELMPYTEEDVGGTLYFGVDKDFNYIRCLNNIFCCVIFLCMVHVTRYWKKKILPSAK